MPTLNEAHEVPFGDTTILAGTVHRVDVNSLLLREVSNSWSRQGFTRQTSSLLLITWRCSANLVFDLVLRGHYILRSSCWLSWLHGCCRNRSFNFLTSFTRLINLEHNMADWNDLIVTKVDLSDFTSGCRGNLCNEFVREDFAQILVLFNFIANLDVPLFDSGLLGSLTQVWQFDCNLSEVSAHQHLLENDVLGGSCSQLLLASVDGLEVISACQ